MRHELGVACVDLDSVLLYHEPEDGTCRQGRVLPLGRKLVQLLRSNGWRVVVLTSRGVHQHLYIHDYLHSKRVFVDEVTNVKPPADAYFDDKAFRIPKNWL
jgi:phosphoserine phosphatase